MSAILLATALLLLLSAVISAAEGAVFSPSDSRVRTLEEEGFPGAPELARLRQDVSTAEAVLLLANTVANLLSLGLLTGAGTEAAGGTGFWATLPGAILAVLLLGEVLPRALATRHPIRIALWAAPKVLVLSRIMAPIVRPIRRLEGVLGSFGGNGEESPEEREVREIAKLGQIEGLVGEDEHALVERAFRLDELTAWDVMTPRVGIFAWSEDLTLEAIVAELANVPYSRVPVYADSVDDITGIVYVREALELFVSGHHQLTLAGIARDPFFVPGSLSLTDLLRDFQARRIHMGIVADEFGGTDGLVTLEDVLEELVGEIVDETDIDEEPLIRLSRSEIAVDAAIDLREINSALNITLPHLDHRSLNGFLLEELGRVPDEGEEVEHEGVVVEVLEATETQVVRARIRKKGRDEDEESTEGED